MFKERGGDNFAYVCRGRGVNEKRTGACNGERGPKLAIFVHAYFMDAPLVEVGKHFANFVKNFMKFVEFANT